MKSPDGVPAPTALTTTADERVEPKDAARERVEPSAVRRSPWPEVIALTLLVPLALACIHPSDPLLLASRFPWLAFVPLLVGAQHGALPGVVSTALLAAVGAGLAQLGARVDLADLAAFAGGCFGIGGLAGFFRDRREERLATLSEGSRQSAQGLARLSRAHAVLELSHRQLEERLAAHGWSLASAFRDAQRALAGQTSFATVGDVVLSILSTHALVQSATLVNATADERGRLELEVSARYNAPARPELGHRLVQRALETGRVVALDPEQADDGEDESILAVAPLRTVSGRLLGLVLIHDLPFMAFHAENLKNLAALAALLADLLEDRFLEAVPQSGVRSALPASDEFVGTRTGTHPRGSIAQSA